MKRIFLFLFLAVFVSAQSFAAFVTDVATKPSEEVSANPNAEAGIPASDAVKSAMKEFKNLSRHEKKLRLKSVKNEIAAAKEARSNGAEPSTNTLLLVILALLLPPLAVYLHQGEINTKFWISLILTLLFFIPGVIYSLIVVLGADKS